MCVQYGQDFSAEGLCRSRLLGLIRRRGMVVAVGQVVVWRMVGDPIGTGGGGDEVMGWADKSLVVE